MKKRRFTESQIVAILKEADGGLEVAEVCRRRCFPNSRAHHRPCLTIHDGSKERGLHRRSAHG